jgi:16S rRNA (cytosine1402-N4)-methyltransferase
MEQEVVALFQPVPAGLLVDATVGGGGHARALLSARDDVDLLGLDRDAVALAAAAPVLAPFGDRVTLRRARFDQLADELTAVGRSEVSGVLFDLGVSSPQLDVADRGFSYRHDGPLDMRMDDRDRQRADDVVNGYSERELADVIRRYGDERHAARIARAIVAARPIHTTTALADIVRDAIPAAARRTGGHPAKRTFQALRIEVNRELAILPDALQQAIDALAEGGRCAVLTYHSGEDRIVKDSFVRATGGDVTPLAGLAVEPIDGPIRFVSRRARRASDAERSANPRSESARLRAVERVAVVA